MSTKLSTPQQLNELRDKYCKNINSTTDKILVCMGGGCIASGSGKVKAALSEELKKVGLDKKVTCVETGCLGPCSSGPVVVIGNDKTFYCGVTPDDAKIGRAHV